MKCVTLQPEQTGAKYPLVFYWCPGCNERHDVRINKRDGAPSPSWDFNGDHDKPSFTPSVNYVGRCHHWVRDGRIEFCGDCGHALAGQTVDMCDVDAEGYKPC